MNLVIISFLQMKSLRLASIVFTLNVTMLYSLPSYTITMCFILSRIPFHVPFRTFWKGRSILGGENLRCKKRSGKKCHAVQEQRGLM